MRFELQVFTINIEFLKILLFFISLYTTYNRKKYSIVKEKIKRSPGAHYLY